MCGDCPDDESLIETHKERILALQERINYTKNSLKDYEAELKSARKSLRLGLRKGK